MSDLLHVVLKDEPQLIMTRNRNGQGQPFTGCIEGRCEAYHFYVLPRILHRTRESFSTSPPSGQDITTDYVGKLPQVTLAVSLVRCECPPGKSPLASVIRRSGRRPAEDRPLSRGSLPILKPPKWVPPV